MSNLPSWAVWSIAVPCILLSPVIAFFLALAVAILVSCLAEAGASALLLAGAGVATLMLLRRLPSAERRLARLRALLIRG